MLPPDWADGSKRPRTFQLPRQWRSLIGRYRTLAEATTNRPRAFDQTWTALKAAGPTHAVLEREYIDADYRDEFAHFYARTFRSLGDRCERLHFYDGDSYQGFAVVRPVPGRPISRSVFWPPADDRSAMPCMIGVQVYPYGKPALAIGFPFLSQDARHGRCAHAAIWMAAYYHHYRHGTPRVFVSDISRAAGAFATLHARAPSQGLTRTQVSAALEELGLPSITYGLGKRELPENETFETITCRYLNSRLPVLVASHAHVVVLIGYGRHPDGTLFFIKHDDAAGPYIRVEDWKGDHGPQSSDSARWKALIVPLPGRIFLAGEDAEAYARSVFETVFREKSRSYPDFLDAVNQGRIRVSTYVQRAGQYKAQLERRGMNPATVARFRLVPTPQWVWVVEAQSAAAAAQGRKCVLGEVVLDATSDPWTPSLLCGNAPGYSFSLPQVNEPGLYRRDRGSLLALYDTGAAVHS